MNSDGKGDRPVSANAVGAQNAHEFGVPRCGKFGSSPIAVNEFREVCDQIVTTPILSARPIRSPAHPPTDRPTSGVSAAASSMAGELHPKDSWLGVVGETAVSGVGPAQFAPEADPLREDQGHEWADRPRRRAGRFRRPELHAPIT